MSTAAKKKEKEEWPVAKPKLENARKLRGVYFIDLEDGECEETIKNTRKNLEVSVQLAMICKMETRKRAWKLREIVAGQSTNSYKEIKYACIVEAHSPQGNVWNLLFREIMRITSQRDGLTH